MSPAAKLFNVLDDLSKDFERDRAVAGLPKRVDRNRTIDVHALRHTFGTMLSIKHRTVEILTRCRGLSGQREPT